MASDGSGGSVTVLVPAPLRQFTGGEAKVTAEGGTVAAVIDDLEGRFPGIKGRVCEADGRIRRFVNVFVNGANVRSAEGELTPVKAGDEIGIVPAMAGGGEAVGGPVQVGDHARVGGPARG